MKKVAITLVFLVLSQISFSQIKKFGKVSKEKLQATSCESFKDAGAVVLFKKQNTHYEYEGNVGWSLVTTVHERIKIYNKDFFDVATKEVRFYTPSNSTDESVSIKAITYNLVAGKVEKTKLKKSEIFTTKENKLWSVKKFTMPNLRENCIVEWEYKINSPYVRNINDVVFQYKIPILYIEAAVRIPEYFIFNPDISKYYAINVAQSKTNRSLDYSYRSQDSFSVETTRHNETVEFFEKIYSIKEKNIPAIKAEPFINNLNNYIGKVRFENIGTKFPNKPYKSYSSTWDDVTKSIYDSAEFGEELKKTRYFENDIQSVINGNLSRDEKINTILNFVKNKVKWNKFYGIFTHDGVKKAYNNGLGNVAEINLILTAMLREAGIAANPVLVSTRSHGVPVSPTREGFNYVIAAVELPEQTLLLDATEKYSTVNVLPKRDLNWQGRIIRKNGSSDFIDLFPKVYSVENNMANIKIAKDGSISGSLRLGTKNLKALEYRTYFSELSEDKLVTELEKILSPLEIEKAKSGNIDNLNKPFLVSLSFYADSQCEIINDKMYFNPLFFLRTKENPFKSEARKLPIDFASPWLVSDNIQIQIPEGYKVETIPESISFDTENGIGSYNYTVSVNNNIILLKSTTKINLPLIPVTMYKELKDFYSKRILKMKEKIVLVKI